MYYSIPYFSNSSQPARQLSYVPFASSETRNTCSNTTNPGASLSRIGLFVLLLTAAVSLDAASKPVFKEGAVNVRTINSASDDYAPSITADGKTMVFNARQKGERYQNIYITQLEKGKWSKPVPLSGINSQFNDETPYISPDGRLLIFSSDRDGSVEMPPDEMNRVKISGDLYWSRKKGGSWTRPRKLPGKKLHTVHHERSPFLSADGKTLYYTTWPFGKIEHSLLMQASVVNGKFTDVKELPAVINSGHQELGLTMRPDGSGAYFSSRRDGGYGGWDLYFISRKNGTWGKAVNMGPAINSRKHELYMQEQGAVAYFCSNRDGGKGRYDIYSNVNASMSGVRFRLVDRETGQPIRSSIEFTADTATSSNRPMQSKITKKTDGKGEADLKISALVSKVQLAIAHPAYMPVVEQMKGPWPGTDKPIVIKLTPLKKNNSFDIHAIHFDYDSARIKTSSYPFLNKLAQYLRSNNALRFEIIGHTDLHGDPAYNMELSRRRAQSVKTYLVGQGLQSGRFSVSGKGKSNPLVARKGPGFDEQNRRTEFRLLSSN
jgi:outer membrane protein OmpA-like peptidoglycan-associated protein/Tol biopolymer transport system component